MESIKKVVLVPWDFTEGSENALQHAIQLADAGGNEIMLLNIIPKSIIQDFLFRKVNIKEIEAINKRFEGVAEATYQKYGIRPQTLVLEGHPKRLIRELILTANINLIVSYHTYLSKGKEFRSSSFLKDLIFKELTLPFIVINKPPKHSHYIEIVIPVDYDRKFKEAVHWIILLAKYYKCNINLIKPFLTDDGQKKQMANNIYFTKKMLDGVGIVYGIKTAKKKGSFDDEVFKFGQIIEADLILIMTDKYDRFVDAKREGSLEIPVMCVNPRVKKYQSFN
ncbi:MAG TPA: universal stress protein [Tenuifilaceae bacterium]|nr:universal stress protein [Tenuifilaceae bacterium]HOZ15905.1 universal stress protein [Tenuifilaceae bacterium]HPI44272.1 universal stress protein [Tenuifilaceae bacterium]HPN20830.1 universal stress protein [Tenuifilaceae bacterium]